MEFRKWYDKYSTDSKLKYPSLRTQENYLCSVGTFLNYFKYEVEPKSITNDKHSNVKTTSIYTHISHNLISKIPSPLQNISL